MVPPAPKLAPPTRLTPSPTNARFATLCGRLGDTLLLEDSDGGTFEAVTTLTLTANDLAVAIEQRSRAVVLCCDDQAVVTGLLQALPECPNAQGNEEQPLVFNAPAGITLRCGEATIRLMPNGRVVLRGDTVISRAKSKSHIVGASVRIN